MKRRNKMLANINKDLYKEIIEEKKVAVIEYWAPWCTYCRRIGPAYDKLGVEYDDKLVLGKVNIDDEPQIASLNDIEVIPTFVFYKDGQAVDGIVAPDSKAKLEEFINRNLGV